MPVWPEGQVHPSRGTCRIVGSACTELGLVSCGNVKWRHDTQPGAGPSPTTSTKSTYGQTWVPPGWGVPCNCEWGGPPRRGVQRRIGKALSTVEEASPFPGGSLWVGAPMCRKLTEPEAGKQPQGRAVVTG